MPVRSLNSSVLKWPDHEQVTTALRGWARELADARPDVRRIGMVGSYARGDWGPGSDLDIVIVLSHSTLPYIERARSFDASKLPVPADLLVYTEAELAEFPPAGRMARVFNSEAIWVLDRGRGDAASQSAHAS